MTPRHGDDSLSSRELAELALQAASARLSYAPDSEEAVTDYALALSGVGKTDEAQRTLRSFLGLSPNSPKAWTALGTVQETAGNVAHAEVSYRNALRIASAEPQARYALGLLLLNNWRTVEAESHLRQLLAQQPDHADGLAIRGQTQQTQGQITAAIASLRRSLALAPSAVNHSKLLAALQYDESSRPQSLL